LHSVHIHGIDQKITKLVKLRENYSLRSHTYLYSEARLKLAELKLLSKFESIVQDE
jgi:hypothetical protein